MIEKKLEFKLIVFGGGQRQHLNTDSWDKIRRYINMVQKDNPNSTFSLIVSDTESGDTSEHFLKQGVWLPSIPARIKPFCE